MKTPEDEAFDDIARMQGARGGGFQAKRKMAADKLQEPRTMDDRQRLEAIVSVINKYLPPLGMHIMDAMSAIISLVDPLPPQREWVGLNEKERNDIEDDFYANISIHVFDAIEAKLKEKNG